MQRSGGWTIALVTWLAVLLHAALGRHALAQPAASDGYDKTISAAVAEFDAGRFLEARALFVQAHALRPNARTLRGMGLAAFEASLYAQAVVDLRAALADQRQPLTEKQRADAQELLQRAGTYTGRYRLQLDPEDASLRVDGAPPLRDETGALLLDLGRHEITASAPEREPRTARVQVTGGETATLDLRLAPRAVAPAVVEQDHAAPVAEPETHATQIVAADTRAERETDAPVTRGAGTPWLAIGAFGGAAAALGVMGWQISVSVTETKAWNDDEACLSNDRTREQNCGSHREAYETADLIALVSGAAAGALAITGLVLLLLHEPPETPETAVRCVPGATALACSFRF